MYYIFLAISFTFFLRFRSDCNLEPAFSEVQLDEFNVKNLIITCEVSSFGNYRLLSIVDAVFESSRIVSCSGDILEYELEFPNILLCA